MEAVAIGSLLAGGGTATAGLSTGALATAAGGALIPGAAFSSGIGLSTIVGGLSLASQAFSIFSGSGAGNAAYDAQIAASKAELEAGKTRFAESELQAQRERTQFAVEEADRQRKLRRTLAAQRASFAGGGVDPFSGSPVSIQEQTAGEINRESRLAELATLDRVTSINTQGLGELAASKGAASSLIGQANTSQAASGQNTLNQLTTLASNTTKFIDTL